MDYLKKAFVIKKSILGEENTEVADVMSCIGSLYWTRKSPKALQYYEYAKKIL